VALGNNSAAGTAANRLFLNGGSVQASGAARTLVNPVVIANDSAIGGTLALTLSGLAANQGGSHTLTVNNSAATTLSGATFSLTGSNAPAALTLDVSGTSGGLTVSSIVQNGSGVGSLVKNGAGILTLGGTSPNTFSGGLTINAGSVTAAKVNALGSGPLTLNSATLNLGTFNQTLGALTLSGGTINGSSGSLTASDLQVQSGALNASLTGSAALTKSTAGTVTLTAANTYSGGTTINAGTLLVNNTSGSGTGSGPVTVNNGGTLGGTGTLLAQVTLNLGAAIAPGVNGPGTLSTANQIWNAGAKFIVEINNAKGAEGSNWDLLKINGSLSVRSSAANPLFVDLHSLTLNNLPGPVSNFTSSANYSWRLVTTTGGITFNSGQSVTSAFSLTLANFNNPLGSGQFNFSLANGNKDLVLSFTPNQVPEPKTWSMITLGFLVLLVRRWSPPRTNASRPRRQSAKKKVGAPESPAS
jgi:autotransporter-associated beta strand protein